MNNEQLIRDYWQCINNQTWPLLARFFSDDAKVVWPNTNEDFTVKQFITVNALYHGNWLAKIEELLFVENSIITVTKVSDQSISHHAISFFEFEDEKISHLKEYWSEDNPPPAWRKKLRSDDFAV